MNLKRHSIITYITIILLYINLIPTSVNASKWHNGVPDFLINTKWKSNKYDFKNKINNNINVNFKNMIFEETYKKSNSQLNIKTDAIFKNGLKPISKEYSKSYMFNNYKYYKKSKNIYRVYYKENDNSQKSKSAYNDIYRINNRKIAINFSKNKSITGNVKNRIYLFRLN